VSITRPRLPTVQQPPQDPRPLRGRLRGRLVELARFGMVGGLSAVVDIGGCNLLVYAASVDQLVAKSLSTVAATFVAYFGNRLWTYRRTPRTAGVAREYLTFFALNGVGLLISLACVLFTRSVLDLNGPLAYNLSANVVGMGLGTAFRYWSYRRWVFVSGTSPGSADPGHRRSL
jgi:putative flippase GtrA